ncbi:MAG: sugar phosphate isomerase/epimerase family protein [Bacteroidota bacterium]
MKIQFFCPYWGSEHLPVFQFLEKIKAAGYDGAEIGIPFEKDFGMELREGLEKFDLKLVAQQHLPPSDESAESFERRMVEYLHYLAGFNPLFIVSHTGRDFYDFETNCGIIEAAENVANETGVTILHETHRARFSFSTFSAKPFFEHFPDMKITADFSHWVCVSETYLDDQPEIMQEAIRRTAHIHARVGYPEGPQVTHPGAPEWEEALKKHVAWWDAIIEQHKARGMKDFPITTEFGAIPYLPTLPFTNQPIVSQWEINTWMKEYLSKRYQD